MYIVGWKRFETWRLKRVDSGAADMLSVINGVPLKWLDKRAIHGDMGVSPIESRICGHIMEKGLRLGG